MGSQGANDYNWNTDDEVEVFGMPSSNSTPIIINSSQESCGNSVVKSGPTCTSTKYAKLIHLFVGMGFSREKVIKAIEQNGEENEEDILETLLTLAAMTEKTFNFERDETLWVLVDMGYPFKEALIAIEKCGPEAQICELTDFMCAAQLEKEIDSHLQDSPKKKHDASVYTHKKQRDHYYIHTNKRVKLHNENWKSKTSAIDMEIKQIQFAETMAGFGIHNQLCSVVARKLPHKVAAGQPYFYYENVAGAPKGVWSKISRFLFEIEPEFVDSKYFCAATRKRGYIHNLPIENRSPLLPIPPLTIQEALPTTKRWWPSWDTRTKLNCLLTSIAPATVTDRIRKVLEECGAEPPPNVQDYVLGECRKWNLIWVGKNKVAPLEPNEYELLLGFPKDHTRGGGISRILRYRALGNTFQVNTVAYHLSVLKGRFPNGINVLSLFSGIGGAEVALHRLGIILRNVVSVEVAEVNRNILRCWWEQTNQRGNLIEVGDIQQVTSYQLGRWITLFGGFDLIIGGSPCNNLTGSNRVSRNGLEGEHSSLFYDYYRIVEAVMDIQHNELM